METQKQAPRALRVGEKVGFVGLALNRDKGGKELEGRVTAPNFAGKGTVEVEITTPGLRATGTKQVLEHWQVTPLEAQEPPGAEGVISQEEKAAAQSESRLEEFARVERASESAGPEAITPLTMLPDDMDTPSAEPTQEPTQPETDPAPMDLPTDLPPGFTSKDLPGATLPSPSFGDKRRQK